MSTKHQSLQAKFSSLQRGTPVGGPRSVFLALEKPASYEVSKETFKEQIIERLTVEIPSEVLDEIAIKWIKYRKLQGAVGGPVGLEWGSPDCPYD